MSEEKQMVLKQKENSVFERILHIHLVGPNDNVAHKEMRLLRKAIHNKTRIMAVAKDSLILKVRLSKKEEKDLLKLTKKFSRLLVLVEWW
jgi:uncharacterized tellurite resistance protein B-like protein